MNRANLKSRVANGDDFRCSVLHAVDDAVISNKNLPYVVTKKFSYDSTRFWEIDKKLYLLENLVFPTPSCRPVAAFGGYVVSALAKPEFGSFRPLDHGTSSCILALRSAISCATKSSCVMYSPRSSSAIPASMSLRVSIHSVNSSQSSTLPMKEVGRPFCVMKMRRCVSAVCFRHAARLLRHSEKEITSSDRRGVGSDERRQLRTDFSLTAGISDVPFLMAYIVHNHVQESKSACLYNGFNFRKW